MDHPPRRGNMEQMEKMTNRMSSLAIRNHFDPFSEDEEDNYLANEEQSKELPQDTTTESDKITKPSNYRTPTIVEPSSVNGDKASFYPQYFDNFILPYPTNKQDYNNSDNEENTYASSHSERKHQIRRSKHTKERRNKKKKKSKKDRNNRKTNYKYKHTSDDESVSTSSSSNTDCSSISSTKSKTKNGINKDTHNLKGGQYNS